MKEDYKSPAGIELNRLALPQRQNFVVVDIINNKEGKGWVGPDGPVTKYYTEYSYNYSCFCVAPLNGQVELSHVK